MESVTSARVPARSRQQAMDWSLVLVSQGIDCAIDFSPELGWGLMISAGDEERALEAIMRYRRENRRWHWRQEIRPALTFDWGSLAWVLLMCAFMWLSSAHPVVRDRGMMDARAVSDGEWWRLFTATFLHGDLAHLAMNASLGVVLLGLVMGSYGTGVGLLVASAAGILGNVATWLAYADHRSLGASGMVTGCIGLLGMAGIAGHPVRRWRSVVATLCAALMLFVLLGLNPESDTLAHFGGFAGGVLLGSCFLGARLPMQGARASLLAGFAYGLVASLAWMLALR